MSTTTAARALAMTVVSVVLALAATACGDSSPSATTTGQTTTTPARPTIRPVKTVTVEFVGGAPVGGIARPTFVQGTRARVIVHTDAGTEVHLHGYDIERSVVPGKPVTIDFDATIPGRFELELHDPDVLLAEITVRP